MGGADGATRTHGKPLTTADAMSSFTFTYATEQKADRDLLLTIQKRAEIAAEKEQQHQKEIADGCKQQ